MMHVGHRLVVAALVLWTVGVARGTANVSRLFVPEDARLDFTQLAVKYGHSVETHEAVTADGYILRVFRIPGHRERNETAATFPVLLMHGVLDSADTWIIRGNDSIASTLAAAGYDVWCGNTRGNRYSRRHVRLDPDRDRRFWDFSFDEHGELDLPAIIDLVLRETGAPRLNAIGHSQGNTVFYVMGSSRPAYNAKVNSLTALAPVCFLQHVPNPLAALIELSPALYAKAVALGADEIPGPVVGRAIRAFCSKPVVGYVKCLLGTIFPLTGSDVRELEPSFYRRLVGHFPAGTSAKNLYHFGQVGRRRSFARFDYGPARNVERYGSEEPPQYELGQVSMPVVLLVGANDYISTEPDAALLAAALPRVVERTLLLRRLTNHADFVFGRTLKEYLLPHLFRILNRFR